MGNNQIEELLKIVVEYLQSEEGNLSGAVDIAVKFSTKNSISSDLLLAQSSLCGSKGFLELAYVLAKTAANSSTGSTKASAHCTSGLASYFMGRPEEAEEQYKLALETDPKHVATHYNYGILLSEMGRPEKALHENPLKGAVSPLIGAAVISLLIVLFRPYADIFILSVASVPVFAAVLYITGWIDSEDKNILLKLISRNTF